MSQGKPGSARILVVDDHEANRSLAKATLEDEGYIVILANNGAEGIDAFVKESPDCVILDVRMPEIDGIGACERMRALLNGADTPILFLTALRDVETFDRALHAGGDDFLTKPIRPTELVVRVESALRLRQLRVELREHYALLKRQRDDLMRLQLQKERLTAFVVHDLKNPVNTMDLHAQLLQREKGMPPGAIESVAQIRVEARHLTRMIVNLLDLAKGDEGQLKPKPRDLDLRAIVSDVMTDLEVNAKGRNLSLRAALVADRIFADEDLFRRTLTNLVENATRYAPQKSEIVIASRHAEGATEVRVADTGAGIPEEKRASIFDAFVQVEDSGQSRSSRGLGLTFCKVAVEAHGGRIWVEDGSPGAVFCLRMPDAH